MPVHVVPASSGPCNAAGLNGATQIAAGVWHSLALLSNGEVCAWGLDGYGQLGDESNTSTHVPTLVCAPYSTTSPCAPLKHVTAISAGGFFSLAIVRTLVVGSSTLTDAAVAWGASLDGELGNGTALTDFNVPQLVCATDTLTLAAVGTNCPNSGAASTYLTGVTAISAGEYNSVALMSGTVVTWGDNTYCELSVGDYCTEGITGTGSGTGGPYTGGCDPSASASPTNCSVDPVDALSAATGNPVLTGVTAVSAGDEEDEALLTNRKVMTWGSNSTGQLGNGTMGLASPDTCYNNNVSLTVGCGWYAAEVVNTTACPSTSGFLGKVTAISAGSDDDLALVHGPDGVVCAWGGDNSGELGDGVTGTASDVPVLVIKLKADAISAGLGSNNLAISTIPNRSIVAWGNGAQGQLGNATFGPTAGTRVYVCALTGCPPSKVTGATLIAAGGQHDLAFP